MGNLRGFVWLAIFSVLVITGCQEQTIEFEDNQLESAIIDEIDADEEIIHSDVEGVQELDLANQEIESLEGLEAFTKLESLNIEGNNVSDLTPIMELENLSELNIVHNPLLEDEEQVALLTELAERQVVLMDEEQIGDPDGPGGFLWKVENEGTTVYLQGTIHVGPKDFYPLHEKIERAYDEADVIVPEIDMNNIDQGEMQEVQFELGMYQDGSTIGDHISDDLYQQLEETLTQFNMSVEMVEMYRPWLLSSLIQQLMVQELGYVYGVDEYFLNQAMMDDKEVVALETVEQQLDVLSGASEEYEITMLEDTLVDLEEYGEELTTMFDIYREGNEEELLDYLLVEVEDESEVDEEATAYMEALNDERNYGMVDKIDEFLQSEDEQTYFVIVGALHLILEPHVVSLLDDLGYDVERVH
ncbi:TraB/GumN family protein [Alkalibacillus aidingensis]|uniref:TraB/GumN family protein n=1 Tax=Alkalibacillus aidingensis TaxID=2747607 RepID=UPI0016607D4A|nr:TraB/GumN family protein [Alkalibacillus aidingensis]